MNFVADESCSRPVIEALRQAGHDVLAIAEVAKGTSDEDVLQLAAEDKRVLITEDRDFGELIYARGRPTAGVVLVRFPSRARHAKVRAVTEVVSRFNSRLAGAFTVVAPGQVRISSRP